MTRHLPLALGLLSVPLLPAGAVVFRSYDADLHPRFDNFPASPEVNPDQLFADLDLTGIGWYSSSPDIQFALVSRQHVVFATHFRPAVTGPIDFLSASGTEITRTQATATIIQDGGQNSDLIVVRLNAPINAGAGVKPLPYLDLATPGDYEGLAIGVAGKRDDGGKFPVIGEGTIAEVETSSRNDIDYNASPSAEWFLNTRYLRFDYRLPPPSNNLDPDDVYFEFGDSGSPSFVDENGIAALVGLHSYVAQPSAGADIENYDTFLPHYVVELDAVLAPDGYRMRPVNAPATTLSDGSSTLQATPRKALPLDFSYTLTNTGGSETGNLEVEFHFDPAEAPDAIATPAGWVLYGGSPSWTFRRALLADGADATFTATWASAPSVAEIDPGIVRRSDTTAEAAPAITIPLAPSFADWAAGLPETGEDDDPDADGLVNLMEYALGGDAADGALVFADGGPLTPRLTLASGTVTLSFPERDDKELRGLSYLPGFSSGLRGWTTTPPAGFVSTTEAYAPPVPGFVKRVLTWTADPDRGFVRLRVVLDE